MRALRTIWRRLDKLGFPLFFAALLAAGIGVSHGIALLRDVGIVVLVSILVLVLARMRSEAWGRPQRPPTQPPPATRR